MKNDNKPPKIFVTDGYKVEHKKFLDKLIFNSFYPSMPAPYIINWEVSVAEKITEEAYIQTKGLQSFIEDLLVVPVGKNGLPSIGFFNDMSEDQIGGYPILSEKIITKNLQLSNIVVSLQSNIQKD